MPRILGMEPRTALLVGAGVAVVGYLYLRSRGSATSPGAPPVDTLPGSGDAISAVGQDTYSQRMQELELSSAQAEAQFTTGQLQRQGQLEEAASGLQLDILNWARGKGKRPAAVMCPDGQPRFDPSTGQFFCRTKKHKSFFSGLNLGKLADIYLHATGAPTPTPGGF